MRPFVEVSGLTITAGDGERQITIVEDVGFEVPRGEVLALIGESGSGKTSTALALLGHARRGCRIAAGSIRVGDLDLRALDARGLERVRGTRISYVAQSASASFNPAHTLMQQVIESGLIHRIAPRAELEARAIALFRAMSLPDPERIGARYPHQVSGGQLQRVMAAMALVADPDLVVFDEPTTALDVTTQIEVLRSFRDVLRARGVTAVYVSHDLAVVSQVADRIVVLQQGRVREAGSMDQVLGAPRDDYTRSLVAAHRGHAADAPAPVAVAAPTAAAPPAPNAAATAPLLQLRGIVAGYGRIDRDGLPRQVALHDLELCLPRGAALGVIGESGSGKSTLARVIAGLVPAARGTLELDGAPLPPGLGGRSREQFRRIQLVFQDADTSLNPAHTIERIVMRPLALYHDLRGDAARAEQRRLLDLVQLPQALAGRYPRELSGGQKQRVSLARALAARPDLLLCDEVTASLDTVVAAAVLELLASLRRELDLSLIFISHDLGATRALCSDLLVLYAGRCVQRGPLAALDSAPVHPYTRLLMDSVPQMQSGWLDAARVAPALAGVDGTVDAGGGALCAFRPRCAVRVEGRCERDAPPLRRDASGIERLCHLEAE
jgi:peptide/nickel transport system ATP-binding protein